MKIAIQMPTSLHTSAGVTGTLIRNTFIPQEILKNINTIKSELYWRNLKIPALIYEIIVQRLKGSQGSEVKTREEKNMCTPKQPLKKILSHGLLFTTLAWVLTTDTACSRTQNHGEEATTAVRTSTQTESQTSGFIDSQSSALSEVSTNEPEKSQESSLPIVSDNEWERLLVNKWNPLNSDPDIETIKLSNGECVDVRIYPHLQEMFDAARNDGIYPVVASGYRSFEEQQQIYDETFAENKVSGMSTEEAKAETERWVAIPGTSEHQTGLAVDINADGINSAGWEVYDWLAVHAHNYGFIKRYSADKESLTGVAEEPWHYRYVGVEIAAKIYEQGVCLEEYLSSVN